MHSMAAAGEEHTWGARSMFDLLWAAKVRPDSAKLRQTTNYGAANANGTGEVARALQFQSDMSALVRHPFIRSIPSSVLCSRRVVD